MTSYRLKSIKYDLECKINNLGVYISDLTDKELKNFEKVKKVNTEANQLKKEFTEVFNDIYLKFQSLELENEYLKKRNSVLSKIVEYRDKIEDLRKEL